MANSILIIGASARAAAESAASAGLSVIAVDQFGDGDTCEAADHWIPLASPPDIQSVFQSFPAIPIMPVGGFENWYEQIHAARKYNRVLAPPPCVVDQLRSIRFLRNVASSSGLGFPETFTANEILTLGDSFNSSPSHLRQEIESTSSKTTFRWLLKNPASSAGLSVRQIRSDDPAELSRRMTQICQELHQEETWIQRHVPGTPYGASFLASTHSTRLLGVCRTITRSIQSTPFLYAGSVGPLKLSPAFRARLLQLGENIVAQSGLRGLFGVDLIFDKTAQQLWLLEINPRYTASMELIDPGGKASLVSQHIDAYAESAQNTNTVRQPITQKPNPVDVEQQDTWTGIKKVVWAKRDVAAIELQRFVAASQRELPAAPQDSILTIHDIPNPVSLIKSNTPVLTIISKFRPTAFSLSRQYRTVLEVENQLYSPPAEANEPFEF